MSETVSVVLPDELHAMLVRESDLSMVEHLSNGNGSASPSRSEIVRVALARYLAARAEVRAAGQEPEPVLVDAVKGP